MTSLNNFKFMMEGLDTTPVLSEIHGDHWKEDTFLRDYPQGPFGDTESVILRFPDRSVHASEWAMKNHMATFDQHENNWLPISKQMPAAMDLVYWLANGVRATRIGRVMINKVKHGGRIDRHPDSPEHANYWSRFHICLHALPGNDFICGDNVNPDEVVNMTTGQVWYFRNDLYHEVHNNSGDYRIHMVIDLKVEDPMFQKPQRPVRTWQFEKPEYKQGINFYVERLADVIDELKPFEQLHWEELAVTKDAVPLDMDWERYLAMEKEAKLHLLVARDGEKVIGYQFTFVGGHFHYKSSLHGMVDLYYLHPEYRNGWVGIKMLKRSEEELKKIGVVKIITGVKCHFDHSKIYKRLGYQHSDNTFVKIIK